MPHPQVEAVAGRGVHQFEHTLERLVAYLRYPAISCQANNAKDVAALGERIRQDLEELGMDNSRLLTLEGALPVVAAEWLRAGDDKPTVLIYGHMDLQPWHFHGAPERGLLVRPPPVA